jgi:hypothetical protein
MTSPVTEAYLDIETTGLTPSGCEITVIGIYLCRGEATEFLQLVGRDICAEGILDALAGIDVIYTYNGSRFDLPFIHARCGVDLAARFAHRDLMFDCWKNRLPGRAAVVALRRVLRPGCPQHPPRIQPGGRGQYESPQGTGLPLIPPYLTSYTWSRFPNFRGERGCQSCYNKNAIRKNHAGGSL